MVIGPWTYIGGRFRWKMTTCPSISIGVGGAMCVQGGGTSFPGGRVLLMPQILSKANPHTAKTMPVTAAMHTSIPSQHEPASATHTRTAYTSTSYSKPAPQGRRASAYHAIGRHSK